jgi:hypothetical protein
MLKNTIFFKSLICSISQVYPQNQTLFSSFEDKVMSYQSVEFDLHHVNKKHVTLRGVFKIPAYFDPKTAFLRRKKVFLADETPKPECATEIP